MARKLLEQFFLSLLLIDLIPYHYVKFLIAEKAIDLTVIILSPYMLRRIYLHKQLTTSVLQ
ncbi:MAG: hypothetical protein ACRC9Q_04520, partial [Bacteroidales bacterium]